MSCQIKNCSLRVFDLFYPYYPFYFTFSFFITQKMRSSSSKENSLGLILEQLFQIQLNTQLLFLTLHTTEKLLFPMLRTMEKLVQKLIPMLKLLFLNPSLSQQERSCWETAILEIHKFSQLLKLRQF